MLIKGLRRAIRDLKRSGCSTIFVDGSFVTSKKLPGDYDACYDISGMDPLKVDPVFLDFRYKRAAQKTKYAGEFLPAQTVEASSGMLFVEFFQKDKDSGEPKGIVELDLGGIDD
jgi:hypothetical protein